MLYNLLEETQDEKTMGNKTRKVTMSKKMKFPSFLSFQFWPIPEIENLEMSESFLLLQFSVV